MPKPKRASFAGFAGVAQHFFRLFQGRELTGRRPFKCRLGLMSWLCYGMTIMSGGRFAIFLTVVLTTWTLMHAFVFWRLASVPFLAGIVPRRALVAAAVLLWLIYPVARVLGSFHWTTVSVPLVYIGAIWIGTLFLLLAALLAVEVVTLCVTLWPQHAPAIRGVAGIVASACRSDARPASLERSRLRGLGPGYVADNTSSPE